MSEAGSPSTPAAAMITAQPAPTTTRSMIAASTRRLSSLGPERGTDGACAIAFTPSFSAILGTPLRPATPRLDGVEPISGPWSAWRSPTWARTRGVSWCSATSRTRPGGASSTRSARPSGSGPGWATSACCGPSASTAPCTPPRCSASFCRASGIDTVEAVATSAIRDAANGDGAARRHPRADRARPARDQRPRGGPLRLARDRQLHHDRRRLRPRHRRRQHPDPPARRPAARRDRVAAARLGATSASASSPARRRPRRP